MSISTWNAPGARDEWGLCARTHNGIPDLIGWWNDKNFPSKQLNAHISTLQTSMPGILPDTPHVKESQTCERITNFSKNHKLLKESSEMRAANTTVQLTVISFFIGKVVVLRQVISGGCGLLLELFESDDVEVD